MLILLALFTAGGIAAACQTQVGFICAGLIAWISVAGLRRMAKKDPLMWQVYLRSLKYRSYYGPFSRPPRKATSSNGEY
jgi:type IV secretion system protein VirB3